MIPWGLRSRIRRARNALALARTHAAQLGRWYAIATTRPRSTEIAVSYGIERLPGRNDVVFGGAVKFQLLAEQFPNSPRDFNVLYLGSSSMPLEAQTLVRLTRRRRCVFAWNQNGVAYSAWHGPGWDLVNKPRARLLHEADHVFYQSEFCKLSADRFYGKRDGPSEVLHNAVDVERFAPARSRPNRPLTLLLGGNQYQRYRVEAALAAIELVRREQPDARLLIAGALTFAPDAEAVTSALVSSRGLGDAVELVGAYSQADAPSLMRRADMLLHTKYNDPCPTVVIEAMACGLPVVYSASGGVPELVGDDAGQGVAALLDWDQDHPPSPGDLAAAVALVADRLEERAAAARDRAVERFDARTWAERHRVVFTELLARR
jgi:glycosyltransferase involved in cell wall biosynthesis